MIDITKYKVWPDWTIGKQIGQSSYSRLYDITKSDAHTEQSETVELIPITVNDAELVKKLEQMIRVMMSLGDLKGITRIQDYKIIRNLEGAGWLLFIRMERLLSLADYIKNGNFSESELLRMGAELCKLLAVTTSRNVFHGDIRPENVYVGNQGEFKLASFGYVRSIAESYPSIREKDPNPCLAPETIRLKKYDDKAEQYGLGMMMHHLSGRYSSSTALAAVLENACAYDPRKRYLDFGDFYQALASVAAHKTEEPRGIEKSKLPPARDYYATVSDVGEVSDLDRTIAVRKPKVIHRTEPEKMDRFAEREEKNTDKKKKSIIIGLVLIIVLSLSIGLGVGLYYWKPWDKSESEETAYNFTNPKEYANIISICKLDEQESTFD